MPTLNRIHLPRYLPYIAFLKRPRTIRKPEENTEEESRTELDSHANMAVVGRNAYIISDTGRIADVNPFRPDYDSMQMLIMYAAIWCYCPCSGQMCMLALRNALFVPSMRNNLTPPFVMREAGMRVNDTPKIQLDDPTEKDHSTFFPETGLRTPLSLWGMFSYFVTSKPTAEEMMETEDVCLLAPSRMNPHCNTHASNEENMLDWEGNRTEGPREPTAARGGAWAFHCPRLGDFSNTYIEKSIDRYASEWACFI
jgi:hypothetical protein